MDTSQTVKKADVFYGSVLGDAGFIFPVVLSVLSLILRVIAENADRERRSG